MRAILQRVSEASVTVESEMVSRIGTGLLILLGVEEADEHADAEWLAGKIANMRIFEDDEERMNVSLLGAGGEAIVNGDDVGNFDGAKNMIDQAINAFGKLDILVNNAGIIDDGLLIRMSDDAWNNVISTNLNGTFYCTRAVLRGMIRRRWGRIINIGSVVGIRGNIGQVNYSASKAAIDRKSAW